MSYFISLCESWTALQYELMNSLGGLGKERSLPRSHKMKNEQRLFNIFIRNVWIYYTFSLTMWLLNETLWFSLIIFKSLILGYAPETLAMVQLSIMKSHFWKKEPLQLLEYSIWHNTIVGFTMACIWWIIIVKISSMNS